MVSSPTGFSCEHTSDGVENLIPLTAAKRGSAFMNSKMPVDSGMNVPNVSMLRNIFTTCSCSGEEAIQSRYLSAVRGYSSHSVRLKFIEMSPASLSLVMSSRRLDAVAALYT